MPNTLQNFSCSLCPYRLEKSHSEKTLTYCDFINFLLPRKMTDLEVSQTFPGWCPLHRSYNELTQTDSRYI